MSHIIRKKITHGMLYASDNGETLLDAVRAIMQGCSYSDFVQDLSDLEGFDRKNNAIPGIYLYEHRSGEDP